MVVVAGWAHDPNPASSGPPCKAGYAKKTGHPRLGAARMIQPIRLRSILLAREIMIDETLPTGIILESSRFLKKNYSKATCLLFPIKYKKMKISS